VGEIIARIAYGHDFYENHGDALIKLTLEGMELAVTVMTQFWAVDLFPICAF